MNKRYKIGFALPSLDDRGGVVVSMLNLANYLKDNGHEIHLFTFGKTEFNKTEHFVYIINESKYKIQLDKFKTIYKENQNKKEFDIFIANNLRTHRICIATKVDNLVCLFHQGHFIKKTNMLNHIIRSFRIRKQYNGQHIAAVSQCLLDNIVNLYKIKSKSQTVLYNSFSFNDNISLDLAENITYPYIVVVSRLVDGKRVDDIIKAYSKLHIKEKLVIVGDGVQKDFLMNITKNLNLENDVLFVGWQDNPYKYIKNASLLVSASEFESFGNVLLEAIELNVPVVSTNYKCGADEILTGELSYYLVNVGDIEQLANKIELALKTYPKIDKTTYKQFELKSITNTLLNLIKRIHHA